MSKKAARRMLASIKPGLTAKEFLAMCADFGTWFDEIQGTDLEEIYYILAPQEKN